MFNAEYYPTDILERLLHIIGGDFSCETIEELYNAIYDLYACAQNDYNRDSFRVFYRALESLCYKIDSKSVQ